MSTEVQNSEKRVPEKWVTIGHGEDAKHVPIIDGHLGDPNRPIPLHVAQRIAQTTKDETKRAGWEKTIAEHPENRKAPAPLRIEDLSDKAIIVRGDTRPHKDRIKSAIKEETNLTGSWHGQHGGWIFPKRHEEKVRAALADLLGETRQAPRTEPVVTGELAPEGHSTSQKVESVGSGKSQGDKDQEEISAQHAEHIAKFDAQTTAIRSVIERTEKALNTTFTTMQRYTPADLRKQLRHAKEVLRTRDADRAELVGPEGRAHAAYLVQAVKDAAVYRAKIQDEIRALHGGEIPDVPGFKTMAEAEEWREAQKKRKAPEPASAEASKPTEEPRAKLELTPTHHAISEGEIELALKQELPYDLDKISISGVYGGRKASEAKITWNAPYIAPRGRDKEPTAEDKQDYYKRRLEAVAGALHKHGLTAKLEADKYGGHSLRVTRPVKEGEKASRTAQRHEYLSRTADAVNETFKEQGVPMRARAGDKVLKWEHAYRTHTGGYSDSQFMGVDKAKADGYYAGHAYRMMKAGKEIPKSLDDAVDDAQEVKGVPKYVADTSSRPTAEKQQAQPGAFEATDRKIESAGHAIAYQLQDHGLTSPGRWGAPAGTRAIPEKDFQAIKKDVAEAFHGSVLDPRTRTPEGLAALKNYIDKKLTAYAAGDVPKHVRGAEDDYPDPSSAHPEPAKLAEKLESKGRKLVAAGEARNHSGGLENTWKRSTEAEHRRSEARATIDLGQRLLKSAEQIRSGEHKPTRFDELMLADRTRDMVAYHSVDQDRSEKYLADWERGRGTAEKQGEASLRRYYDNHSRPGSTGVAKAVTHARKVDYPTKATASQIKAVDRYNKVLGDIGHIDDGRYRMQASPEHVEKLREAWGKLKDAGAEPKSQGDAPHLTMDAHLKLGYRLPVHSHQSWHVDADPIKLYREWRDRTDPGAAGAKRPTKAQDLERALIGRKFPGFFPTQPQQANELLDDLDIKPGMSFLEPSAGTGHIADLARERGADVHTIEQQPALREVLEAKGHKIVGHDSMAHDGQYDRIGGNPAFEGGHDVDEVRRTYDHNLKPGGKMSMIVGEHPFFANDAKSRAFREWLHDTGADVVKLPEGAFKASGTGANARRITVEKRA